MANFVKEDRSLIMRYEWDTYQDTRFSQFFVLENFIANENRLKVL